MAGLSARGLCKKRKKKNTCLDPTAIENIKKKNWEIYDLNMLSVKLTSRFCINVGSKVENGLNDD